MVLWSVMKFDELSTQQLYDIIKLRIDVFVVEQNCPYPELDNKDTLSETYHVLGKNNDDELVTYARLLPVGVSFKEASIGRVVTKPSARGKGLGHALIKNLLKQANHFGLNSQFVSVRKHSLKVFINSMVFKKYPRPIWKMIFCISICYLLIGKTPNKYCC